MPEETAVGGFGTRIYFIPSSGMDPKSAQILKGRGYVTLNLKRAHYRSEGCGSPKLQPRPNTDRSW